jgi:hypothetical protein
MSCMGGWCHLRDKCRHHAPNPHQPVLERLCERGDFDAFEPLIVTRQAGSWERPSRGLAPATWMESVA